MTGGRLLLLMMLLLSCRVGAAEFTGWQLDGRSRYLHELQEHGECAHGCHW